MAAKRTDRRGILGMGALLAGAGVAPAPGFVRAARDTVPWRPALEPQDDWMDRPGTRHRLVFDTASVDAARSAIGYAGTFYAANRDGYGLDGDALGVIVVLRHTSTPFGYADAAWARYGATLASMLKLQGIEAIRAAQANPVLSTPVDPKAKAGAQTDGPATLASLAAKGARFAVCATDTRGLAGQLAKATGAAPTTVEDELRAHFVPGAVLVPAGVVAVNRAQERGYALFTTAE